jgi:hypothetical protein
MEWTEDVCEQKLIMNHNDYQARYRISEIYVEEKKNIETA